MKVKNLGSFQYSATNQPYYCPDCKTTTDGDANHFWCWKCAGIHHRSKRYKGHLKYATERYRRYVMDETPKRRHLK